CVGAGPWGVRSDQFELLVEQPDYLSGSRPARARDLAWFAELLRSLCPRRGHERGRGQSVLCDPAVLGHGKYRRRDRWRTLEFRCFFAVYLADSLTNARATL